jgi:thioredoxin 1
MGQITVTDANFAKEVEESKEPVLVDFWAKWCGPCRLQGPIVEELAKEFDGKVKVAKLEVDENPHTAARFGIMSIPTLAVFLKGKAVKGMIGLQSKDALKQVMSSFVK